MKKKTNRYERVYLKSLSLTPAKVVLAAKKKCPKREARDESEMVYRSSFIEANDINEKGRSVDVSFSSETDRVLRGWNGEPQILLHEPSAVDGFRRIKNVGAVLLNHDENRIIGRATNVKLDEEERKGRATIVFDDDQQGNEAFAKVKSGSLRGVSAGFMINKRQILAKDESWDSPGKRTFKGPAHVITKWDLFEFSLTPIPADASVGVGRTLEEFRMPRKKTSKPVKDEEELLDEEEEELETDDTEEEDEDEEREEETERKPPKKPKGKKPEKEKEETSSEEDIREEERARITEIRAICSLDDRTESLADKLIEDGVSINEARKLLLDHLRKVNPAKSSPRRVEFGEEEKTKKLAAMQDSLMLRTSWGRRELLRDEKKAQERQEAVNQLCCFNYLDLARTCLSMAGISFAGLDRDQIFRRAIAHSSSDFPKLLENIMNKALLQAWQEAPATWRPLVKVVSANDFKQMSRVKLGDSGDLVLTPELAPMAEGTVPEAGEKYAIATYSKRFGVSRQALINDDLAALDSIPRLMGAAAARVPAKLFYDLLLSASGVGPTMSEDSKALFATDHPSGANYTAGTGAPDVSGLTVGLKLMRLQKGMVGAGETAPFLNLMPAILLVPVALEIPAKQTINSIVDPSKNNAANNPFSSSLQIVVEPRLDGGTNGTTAWYLISQGFPGAEVAFLNGQEAPTTVREEGTNILGVEMGVYLDCGVKFVEHRSWYRCKGA